MPSLEIEPGSRSMTPAGVVDVARESIITLLMVAGPLMVVALAVGLVIALFQALTSVQEVTLTFVPKILIVFVVMLLVMPFMAGRLESLTHDLFSRMAHPLGEVAAGQGSDLL